MAKKASFITIEMETRKFNRHIDDLIRNLNSKEGALAMLQIAFQLMQRVIVRTPVLYGMARAGWYKGQDQISKRGGFGYLADVSTPEESRGYKLGRFRARLTGPNKHVTIGNLVPYVLMLEYGWSRQAPQGMLRVSMASLRGALGRSYNRQIAAMWRKNGRKATLAEIGGIESAGFSMKSSVKSSGRRRK